MIILGIDPGTKRMGYGFVRNASGKNEFLAAGVLGGKARRDADNLSDLHAELVALIRQFQPEALSIEKLFFMQNRTTGLQVAEARGIALLCAAECGLEVMEFSPNEVKMGLTGYGHADKHAVEKMVRLVLRSPELKLLDDAWDALALAVFAGRHLALRARGFHPA